MEKEKEHEVEDGINVMRELKIVCSRKCWSERREEDVRRRRGRTRLKGRRDPRGAADARLTVLLRCESVHNLV